ncbi:MAG: hypothetical protein EHM55_06555 [Acidobacteria bacterium]|nr:MAG: hypothetical protein EHM55_06555 [Acidobacteriota bacterium]
MSVRPWWLLPPGRIHAGWWIALGALLLWVDHVGGPTAAFPLLYTVPVILAAWYSGKWPAVTLAIAVPLLRVVLVLWAQNQPVDLFSLVLATTLRGTVILLIALWFARLADFERDLTRHVKVLEGMLPICSFCKSIRNESGTWERLELFISRRSEAEFSHGVCPSCGKVHYPDILDPEESVTTR